MPITQAGGGVPAGTVAYFAAASAPAGFLKANGAIVSRAAYAALFLAIGTTYGAGDGATTFQLPDLRGEFPRGLDDGRGVDVGRAIGSAQAAANASHSHGAGTLAANSAGAHSHTEPSGTGLYGGTIGAFRTLETNTSWVAPSAGAHTHTVSGSTGSEGSEARPRNVALLACIKF